MNKFQYSHYIGRDSRLFQFFQEMGRDRSPRSGPDASPTLPPVMPDDGFISGPTQATI